MPGYVVIPVDGLRFHEDLLDEQMDEPVYVKEIISGLMPSLQVMDLAEMELDYHCLHLMEESAQGRMYHWYEPVVDYVKYVGGQIFRGLRDNGAYLNGVLPYRLWRVCGSCLYFQRTDLFAQEVNKELRNDEQQFKTWLPRREVPRDTWLDPYYGVPYDRRAADPGPDRTVPHGSQYLRAQHV